MWIDSPAVLPRLDRGIQLKNTSIFIVFLDTVVKPRYDKFGIFRSMQQCLLAMTTYLSISPNTISSVAII
ncbi:MAG: palindromic element RPE4 domain-containing protein, partial [Candidatus Midichloria mitochondrii]|nr:palindromic element RPE4 domain-containing protein [Candidatus Midichloria mitochondrii]